MLRIDDAEGQPVLDDGVLTIYDIRTCVDLSLGEITHRFCLDNARVATFWFTFQDGDDYMERPDVEDSYFRLSNDGTTEDALPT